MTGIELIAKERQEQIEKHGRTVDSDVEMNAYGQLVEAIMMISANIGFRKANLKMPKECFEDMKPLGWGREILFKILDAKSIEDQLAVIGALAAAEIDRLNALK